MKGKNPYPNHLTEVIQSLGTNLTNPNQKVLEQEFSPDRQQESHQRVKERVKHKENSLVS